MSQKRIQDYGTPVVAKSFKLLTNAIMPAGILDGNEFVVDAVDRMRINPGTCITHQGVIIIEDETKFLTIQNTSIPADYTIFYSHEDADISGGAAAILTLDSGLLTSDVVEGCILGYVRYPGSGIPLDQSHFIQPAHLKIGNVIPTRENSYDWRLPVRSKDYMITATSGSTITITDRWDLSGTKPEMYLRLENTNLTNGSVTLTFPYKVGELPFGLLQMIIGTDINALLTPHFIDSAGTVFTLSSPFSGQPTLSLKSVDIPRTTVQSANTVVYLQLEISLAASRVAKIQAVGLNPYSLPI